MVNPLSGGTQQPFGTLYQPGGTSKTDQRVPTENRSRTRENGATESAGAAQPNSRAAEKSEKSEEVSVSSYKKDAGNAQTAQRGQVLNITV